MKGLLCGRTAGYGLQFAAEQNMKIAELAIGYAGGIPRALSYGVGCVLLKGRNALIVGRICMDQMLIDVSKIPGARSGNIAVLIERSDRKGISVYDIAEQVDTISTEILSRLGSGLRGEFYPKKGFYNLTVPYNSGSRYHHSSLIFEKGIECFCLFSTAGASPFWAGQKLSLL